MQRNPLFRKTELYPCEGRAGRQGKKGYLEDCGKPLPFIDRIEISAEKESVPLRTKFLQGYYDSPQIERLDNGQGFLIGMADSKEKEEEYKNKNFSFRKLLKLTTPILDSTGLTPL